MHFRSDDIRMASEIIGQHPHLPEDALYQAALLTLITLPVEQRTFQTAVAEILPRLEVGIRRALAEFEAHDGGQP